MPYTPPAQPDQGEVRRVDGQVQQLKGRLEANKRKQQQLQQQIQDARRQSKMDELRKFEAEFQRWQTEQYHLMKELEEWEKTLRRLQEWRR